jgi:hypothetical protein
LFWLQKKEEERKTKKVAEEMKRKIFGKILQIFCFLHPENLPGEIQGKGANVNFAIEKVKEEIKEIDPENIIFSVFDVDTRPYPDYFTLVTYHYLKLKKEKNVCFPANPRLQQQHLAGSFIFKDCGHFQHLLANDATRKARAIGFLFFPFNSF